jgi:ABC-type Zn uptake system ZnuABC Zn-binding protein ZnuA
MTLHRIMAPLLLALACAVMHASSRGLSVVVTTSMLETAIHSVLPPTAKIDVIRLLPPGSCPGHFDLSPSALPALRAARLVIRHDYQDVLEEKVNAIGNLRLDVLAARTPGSLLIPENYQSLVNDVAQVLSALAPEYADELLAAAQAQSAANGELSREIRREAQAWAGTPVISSSTQKQFCEWLGLQVVGTLNRPEEISPREYQRLLALRPALLVANLQEGPEAALSLGRRLGVPVAVVSNFPGADGYGSDYEGLLRENLSRVAEAWDRK